MATVLDLLPWAALALVVVGQLGPDPDREAP